MLLALSYHRVAHVEPGSDFWGLSVSPENFASHLEFLTRHFEIIDAKSISLAAAAKGAGTFALVTFDDGYADNLYAALPALQRLKVPALIFVASGYIGRPYFWWDAVEAACQSQTGSGIAVDETRLQATWDALRDQSPTERDQVLRELLCRAGDPDIGASCRPLTKPELAELAACSLVSFGGHTRWHPWLPALSAAQMEEEITAGKLDNTLLTGQPQVAFAYPFGAQNASVRRAVLEAGFSVAFTTSSPSRASPILDPLIHPRIVVGNWDENYFHDVVANISVSEDQND